MKKYYVTTPLYYVNAKPHLGHAYTTVAADALARAKRLLGYEVFFLTGTDEHGQKVEKASEKAGLSPQEFTDQLSGEFRELWRILNIQYDDFIRTTEKRHVDAVQMIWKKLQESGWIGQKKYEGWYCTPCEAFWPYREIGSDEKGKTCPQCGRALESIQEDNYFFLISKFQDWLIQHIRENPNFIRPETRRNETLSFLEKNELMDLCISRPKARLQWGIESPLSEDHVTYVWFDALINYISACGYPDKRDQFEKFWPANVHLIGKDILRPHTIYWPVMLHALGIAPPEKVFAHGWWMVDKAKMSKSTGNVVNPIEVVDEYGIDPFRYFLLREVPFGQDGTYSDEAMTLRYNVDLANDLGNLLHRTLNMFEKYYNGIIPAKGAKDAKHDLMEAVVSLPGQIDECLSEMAFSDCLATIWNVVGMANKFIEEKAPWTLKKNGQEDELKAVMVSLAESLRVIIQAVWPFMPESAEKMWLQLGLKEVDLVSDSFYKIKWDFFQVDTQICKGNPIFPRRLDSEAEVTKK